MGLPDLVRDLLASYGALVLRFWPLCLIGLLGIWAIPRMPRHPAWRWWLLVLGSGWCVSVVVFGSTWSLLFSSSELRDDSHMWVVGASGLVSSGIGGVGLYAYLKSTGV